MTRYLQYALLTVLLCAGMGQAQVRGVRLRADDIARFSQALPAAVAGALKVAVLSPARAAAVGLSYTLPPEPKPTTHWPWWLRILAVVFVLVFIRIVAGSVRSKPSGPGPV